MPLLAQAQIGRSSRRLPRYQILLSNFLGASLIKKALDFAISTNAKQINLATSALHDLKWVEEVLQKYGDRLSISLDVEAGSNQLIARGSGDNLGDLFQMINEIRFHRLSQDMY
jgi:hypothetical protein